MKTNNHQALAISVKELADRLGISRPVAYRLVKRADFPAVHVSDNRIIIPVGPLEQWLEDNAFKH